jgi:excisionase family DNA binding protein
VPDLPEALTVEETAKVLRIGRSAAYDAVRRGEIPSIKIGRTLRIPGRRLQALLEGDVDDAAE